MSILPSAIRFTNEVLAPDEIGQQRLVVADRCVDPAWPVQFLPSDHLLIERLAHAVQALELVLPGIEILAGHGVDRRHGLRVMRGELRIDRLRRRQQTPCTGKVTDVRVHLAGIDRESFKAFDLRALDLGIPVGALHQPHHQPMPAALGEIDQEVDDDRGALLIRLDHEADAVPALECRVEAERLEDVER
jgi:hypothetical protein